MAARIIAVAGPLEGGTWELDSELTIGRDGGNAVAIDDASLSRRHCLVVPEADHCLLRDLDSSNGTFVNGSAVTSHRLSHGDQIRAGRSLFRYLEREDAQYLPRQTAPSGHTQVLRLGDSQFLRPETLLAVPPTDRIRRELAALLTFVSTLGDAHGASALARHLVTALQQASPGIRTVVLAGREDLSVLAQSDSDCEVSSGLLEEAAKANAAVFDEPARALAAPIPSAGGRRAFICLTGASLDAEHLQFVTALAGAVAQPLASAFQIECLEEENRRLQAEVHVRHDMVGDGPAMQQVYAFIAKAAPTPATVLIRGESGTGKELAARAIHRNSPRTNGPFAAINCAALTETLLESELFGHEKGAFTGAAQQKRGRIEEAQGGTLFLDEIGEMAPALQAKLLRVLQEREFVRVGGTRPIKADIRLITATHRDLEAMVKSTAFRQDLYYRLNVVSIRLPALRDRPDDIAVLALHFLRKHGQGIGRRVTGISPAALWQMKHYAWPGNVRELENAVERALVLGSTEEILPDDLPAEVAEAGAPQPATGPADFHEQVKQAKRRIVTAALESAGRDFNEAARRLGLHPSNLYRLVRNLDMRE